MTFDVCELLEGYNFSFNHDEVETFFSDGKHFLTHEGKYHCFNVGDERVLNLEDDWDEIKEKFYSASEHSGSFLDFVNEIDDLKYTSALSGGKFDRVAIRCIEEVYEANGGDGNELTYTFKFTNPKNSEDYFFVNFDGWYSSWDESRLESAYVSKPYVFTETRYKPEI